MKRNSAGTIVRGVVETTTLAASLLSHLGWWLDWQTRPYAGQGSRPLGEPKPLD